MPKVSATIDVSVLREGDHSLSKLGIQPFFIPTLQRWDLDPDQFISVAEQVLAVVEDVRRAGHPAQQPLGGDDCWTGPAQQDAEEYRKCVAAWWQEVLDFLLGIVDWVIQLVDWVLDAIRWLCGVLTWLAGWVTAFVTAAALILLATGVGAAALPVLGTIDAWAGAIAVLSFLLGIILRLLDYLVEWLQDLIRSGRDSLCGSVIPRTDPLDWDPDPLPLPTWPF